MKRKLTEGFVARAEVEPGKERSVFWDETEPGFGLMVTSGGHRSFVVQYRAGKVSRRLTLKGGLSVADARKEARAVRGAVAKGGDPLQERRKEAAASANTLRAVAEEYFAREGSRLRTIDERRAAFERLIFPKLGDRQIGEIKRSEIVRLLDAVEESSGPSMADDCLAFIRKLMNWHATRSDDFRSPIIRGMARTKAKERARQRILSDEELVKVWKTAAAQPGAFSALIRFLLLTASRRDEARCMTRAELNGGSDWILPAARNKVSVDLVRPLSDAALAILKQAPRIDGGEFIFSNGRRPLSGLSREKKRFDRVSGTSGWTLHDLRRTARSLMSRAGVPSDHAERCLGHVIAGVRGVYDRHEYHAEKRDAYKALAVQIERIVNPVDNVTEMRAARKSRRK